MVEKVPEEIGIYCHKDKAFFRHPRAKRITCLKGGELISRNFPYEGLWECCCGCLGFWPKTLLADGQTNEQCPLCERTLELDHAYLCDQCGVLSFQAAFGSINPITASTGSISKSFVISPKCIPEPACPGCLNAPNLQALNLHLCNNGNVIFATALAICPFCKQRVETKITSEVVTRAAHKDGIDAGSKQKFAPTEEKSQVNNNSPRTKRQLVKLGALWAFPLGVAGLILSFYSAIPSSIGWYWHKLLSHQPPILSRIQNDKRELMESESIWLEAIVQDHDGQPLKCEWTPSPAGRIEGEGCKVLLNTSEIKLKIVPFRINVALKVTDSYGASASRDLEIFVLPVSLVNKSPILDAIKPSAQEVRSGETVTLTALARDPDNDQINYQWQNSSNCQIIGTGQTVSLNTSAVNPQSSTVPVTVTLLVSDARGGAVSGSVMINVVPKQPPKSGAEAPLARPLEQPNGSPILISLQPHKSSVQAGERVEIEAIATDPNSDRLEYVWEPVERIEGHGTRVTLKTLKSDAQNEANRIIVTLTVMDRRGGSASGKTIINISPAPQPPIPTPHPTSTSEVKPE
ncbi:MAG TPA: hypothetical protein VEY11_08235 [Pyrinomonadaceae bacterium]|nr:hypothetical protein [Pyrinomonadaceae bacterium]